MALLSNLNPSGIINLPASPAKILSNATRGAISYSGLDRISPSAVADKLARETLDKLFGTGVAPAQLGMLGDVQFATSEELIRNWRKVTRKSTAQWSRHGVIGSKPPLEFVGYELDSIGMEILFVSNFVDPVDELARLREQMGKPVSLVLGWRVAGTVVVNSISEEWIELDEAGLPLVCSVDVELSEYIESVPTQATDKLAEDELRRAETGRGGPIKIQGAAAPKQQRNLVAVMA